MSYGFPSFQRLFLVIVAGFLLFTASGCGKGKSPDQNREKALAKPSNEIVIGVVWPFANQNDQFREGLHLALEQVNAAGVLGGKKIRLVERDDNNSVITAMAIAQELAEDLTLSAVIGHRSSAVTVPVSQIYDNAGLLLLAPASTSPNLTKRNSSFIFRNIPSDEQIGARLAQYAREAGYHRVAIYYSGDEYGRGLANAFEEQANLAGLKIVDRRSDFKGRADVQRMADKWELLDVEVVLLATNAREGIRFIRELRASGFDKPVIGGDALDNDQFVSSGDFVEGTVVVSIYHPDVIHHSDTDSSLNTQFRQQFREKYGTEPGKWAAQAYDSLRLLADMIERAQSRNPKEIAKQLASGHPWEGVVGRRSFDANGNVEGMELVEKQVRGGRFEIIGHSLLDLGA